MYVYWRLCVVPEEFMYNPLTRVYGEPHRRPEVQNATIEFMAPSEYMVSLHIFIQAHVMIPSLRKTVYSSYNEL